MSRQEHAEGPLSHSTRLPMRKLILEEFVSADGLAADAEGTTAFFENSMPPDGEETRDQLAGLTGQVDTILLGAETYRMFLTYWPTADSAEEGMADWINETPKVVVSNTLDSAPWGDYPPARVLPGDATETVAALKRESGGDIIVWGSLTLAQSLLAAGLVDEVRLNTIPVLVGAGRRMFEHDGDTVPLRLLDARTYQPSGVVRQRFAVGSES